MALRFMQIFLPENADQDVTALLKGHELLGTWRDAALEGRIVLHLLVPAEETEPITDGFEQIFSGTPGFRIVLLPVEAALPRPEADGTEVPNSDDIEEEARNAVKEPGRVSRGELYDDIVDTLGITRVFVAMTILSTVVAAVGLMRNDVAVIIGAMVIAPLLGPNVAMSLATTLGDVKLLRRALITNVLGVVLAAVLSVGIGFFFPVDPTVPTIAVRSQLGLGDIVLALAAGSAGTFAFTRGLTGAVIGVMVAVALMPPLVTFGMLLGSGLSTPAFGALLLVLANVICINLAGVGTFLAQGVRPRTWWEEERARKAARTAMAFWCILLMALGLILYLRQLEGLG
jgi:uncharacterized hydrophobic protein (TIGR00341 family)